jgi:hypothetical protein
MMPTLPRTASILGLSWSQPARLCIRRITSNKREFCVSVAARKIEPPRPADITNRSGVDLNEFTGPPGWTLDELLPPSHQSRLQNRIETSITPETLRHLLHLSGLPPSRSSDEESNLLSALHDQLHFVNHVKSVHTEGVEPLIRIGDECRPGCTAANCDGHNAGVLSYEACEEEGKLEDIPGLEWIWWNVTGLTGGSPEGREDGWFVVQNEPVREINAGDKGSEDE